MGTGEAVTVLWKEEAPTWARTESASQTVQAFAHTRIAAQGSVSLLPTEDEARKTSTI